MNIEAVVIKKIPIREHDQLVVLYSAQLGKCAAIAKGSLRGHSTQALALDEGNLIRGELVSGKTGFIMTGAQTMRGRAHAKSSPVRWAGAQCVLQIVDMLVYDHQPDAHLWACLTDALHRFDSIADDAVLATFRSVQGALLNVLGYGTQDEALLTSTRGNRTAMDEQFEHIAQRRLTAIDVFYDVAARRSS